VGDLITREDIDHTGISTDCVTADFVDDPLKKHEATRRKRDVAGNNEETN